jgi:hypothetical protein
MKTVFINPTVSHWSFDPAAYRAEIARQKRNAKRCDIALGAALLCNVTPYSPHELFARVGGRLEVTADGLRITEPAAPMRKESLHTRTLRAIANEL